jgi:hypothetical protein
LNTITSRIIAYCALKVDGLDPLMMLPLIMMSKGGMAGEGASSLLPLLLLSGEGKPRPADKN